MFWVFASSSVVGWYLYFAKLLPPSSRLNDLNWDLILEPWRWKQRVCTKHQYPPRRVLAFKIHKIYRLENREYLYAWPLCPVHMISFRAFDRKVTSQDQRAVFETRQWAQCVQSTVYVPGKKRAVALETGHFSVAVQRTCTSGLRLSQFMRMHGAPKSKES